MLQEYPFFAKGRGWVSCCPHMTSQLYQLPCQQLAIGDVCMVWSPRTQGHDTPGAWQEPSPNTTQGPLASGPGSSPSGQDMAKEPASSWH